MPRPRKPTILHLAQGTYRKDRHGARGEEPKPALGAKPPPWLPPAALEVWARLAPMLTKAGILTEVDGEALGLLCALLVQAGEQARGGALDPRLSAELRAWQACFGMSPASRSKVHAQRPEPKGKLARFLDPDRPA